MTLDYIVDYYVEGWYTDDQMELFVRIGMITQDQYNAGKERKSQKLQNS